LFECFLCFCGSSLSIERSLELCRRDVADRLKQARVVEPVDPLERRELDLFEALPGPLVADDLGLVEADHAFGHGVVVGVAAAPDRGLDPASSRRSV